MSMILAIGLVACLIVAGPLLTIWALNTLFNLGIPFTIWSWLAVWWICIVLRGPTHKKER